MASDSSWVYGLRHQARCLTAVTSKNGNETSKYLVGTVGVKNNLVCLLEFDENKSEIIPTLYEHPDEVWDVSSCPADEMLLFTSHSQVGSDPRHKKATLWKRTGSAEKSPGTRHALQQVTCLEKEGVSRILWDPTSQETASRIAYTCAQQLHLAKLNNASATTEVSIKAVIDDSDECITNATWNPHDTENMITTIGSSLAGWDFRSGKNSFTKHKAHKSTVRALDYNPNKPYHVATGGDDALVSIWDVRQLSSPAMTVEGHTHWVWSVAFNRFHDQLLLTSGSDTLVNLHNVISVSSASYLRSEEQQASQEDGNNQDEDYWSSYKPSDGLICTYDQHEDSVYSTVWSTADTWTFASLSYAGRVVISQVPTGEKFKILGV